MPNTSRYFCLKDAGLCTRCGKAEPADGRVQCPACIQAEALARPTQMKARYYARIAAGLCSRCGKRPPREGLKECEDCRTYTLARDASASDASKERRRENQRAWRKADPERDRQRTLRYREKLRTKTFERYGTTCQCCGESNWAFLTLDHTDGNGNVHRRALFGANIGGGQFYKHLRSAGWPDGYQTLCYNCNMAKAHYGVCPHQTRV